MKKIIYSLSIFILSIIVLPVQAANYELRELIPVNTETTITTDNFSYRDFYYNNNEKENNYIIFKSIKNISDKELPVSISVAFFDKDKKNIGIINYCSTKDETSVVSNTVLKSKEEKSFVIEVNKKILADKKAVKDIRYISVLSENINCNNNIILDSAGKKVDDIGKTSPNIFREGKVSLLLLSLGFIAFVLIILFLYKFLFTTAYTNFNGDDIRQGYKKYNKELKEKREYEERVNPKPVKKPIKTKSDEIIQQEEKAAKEDKSGTDLHNLYK